MGCAFAGEEGSAGLSILVAENEQSQVLIVVKAESTCAKPLVANSPKHSLAAQLIKAIPHVNENDSQQCG